MGIEPALFVASIPNGSITLVLKVASDRIYDIMPNYDIGIRQDANKLSKKVRRLLSLR